MTGWPDRLPAGPFTAYTDYISARLSVVAMLAGLERRNRTGKGCHIYFAQLEGALHFLAPQLLDQEINGRTAGRHGNADAVMAPHAVYPAAGDDRWVAIACESDGHWAALADTLGAAELRDLTLEQRLNRSDEIDQLVAAWTVAREPGQVTEILQALGVPAHGVADAADTVADSQLAHRDHYRQAPHPSHGMTWVEGPNYTLSRTPSRVDWGGPTFGQHNSEVLGGILGYDVDLIADLIIAGAVA